LVGSKSSLSSSSSLLSSSLPIVVDVAIEAAVVTIACDDRDGISPPFIPLLVPDIDERRRPPTPLDDDADPVGVTDDVRCLAGAFVI
jgi:hypothetical protein